MRGRFLNQKLGKRKSRTAFFQKMKLEAQKPAPAARKRPGALPGRKTEG